MRIIALACLFALMALPLQAATYYVDYDAGKDANSGTTAGEAWRHCPGDEQAKDKAGATRLAAGDKVVFKGGVRYRGSIAVTSTGAEGKPIIFDGNVDSTFGKGPAIVDGSVAFAGWKRCASAKDAEGNPKWEEIWYTDVEHDGSWRDLNLLGPELPMPVAQYPNPKDPMLQESLSTYLRSKQGIKRGKKAFTFADPVNLAGKPADYFVGMGLAVHAGHNMVRYTTITGFDPATHMLTMRPVRDRTYDKATTYCFFNSVKLIDTPGEYARHPLEGKRVRVFTWPHKVEDGCPVGISRSVRRVGFEFTKAAHVVVRGFKIERQGGKNAYGVNIAKSKDIQIKDCEVSLVRGVRGVNGSDSERVRIEGCYVHHLPGHTFGVFLRRCKKVAVVRTRIYKPTATALDFYTVHGGLVSQCEVSGHRGMHANGLTFYLGNRDLVIERNYVHGGNIPLTIKQAGNVVIRNNIFDGANRSMAIAMWSTGRHEKSYWKGPTLQNVRIVHNILVRGSRERAWKGGLFSNMKDQPQGLVVKNNILDGVHGRLSGDYSHNIYTREVSKAFMGKGCKVVTDLKKIFVDAQKGDFRLQPGCPALSAGIDMGVEDDFAGKPRDKGKTPTIGAYAGASQK